MEPTGRSKITKQTSRTCPFPFNWSENSSEWLHDIRHSINACFHWREALMVSIQYECADCRHRFPVNVSKDEMETFLQEGHTECCPNCGQRVGYGTVSCRKCATNFVVEMVHWHVYCDLARGVCPDCGSEFVSTCIC